MERRALLALGIAAAAGAALVQPLDPTLRALLAAALLGAALLMLRDGEPERFRASVAAALVAGAGAGILHDRLLQRTPIAPHTIRAACTVLDAAPSPGGGAAYTCVTDGGERLAVNGAGAPPPLASRVLVRGRIEPFDGPRNPGEPDSAAIEREKGLDAHLAGAHVLTHLPDGPLTPPLLLARLHAWALMQLRARLAEPYVSILAGELWGERGALPPELRAEFQQTGTVHILVTAGLHLGVVALATMALLRAAGAPRVAASGLAIAVLWAYAAFSGFHVPALRAAIMISFGLCAYAAGAASRSWNAYGAALLIFALLRPEDVASASFALSFSCVGAILLFGDALNRAVERTGLPERVREAVVLTVATQIGTWPLTAAVFLIFSPYAVFANLFVVPCVGATMLVGGAQLALAPLPPLAQLAANVNSWLLAWIVAAVHAIATLPHASPAIAPPHAWAICVYDLSLVAGVWLWRREARTPALAIVLLAVSLLLAPPLLPDGLLRITVLDVGQADGIVIQTPRGHTILVDTGGRLERGSSGISSAEQAGERIVVPFLRRSGIRRIEALILSHPHGDHVGAAAPILRDGFSVDELADSGQQYMGYAWRDAIATARADRVPVVYPRAGMAWRTDDGVTLTFIGPSLPLIVSDNTINDNSIAFILQYKRFRMLFTGDAGAAAEQRFLSEGIALRADVLKVGHHGSAYSSSPAFIAAVHPRFAIISVGRHNMFGHPAPSTLETLQRFGAQIYRTDQNGAAAIASDGTAIRITDMIPP